MSKIEETASGAVVCQLLDAIYPGEVPMSKVRWDARSPHEFIENYKIVQAVLEKKGVDKHIEVRSGPGTSPGAAGRRRAPPGAAGSPLSPTAALPPRPSP